MTSRRQFVLATALGAIAPAQVLAQAKRVRVGMLAPRQLGESGYAPHLVRRLEELGYRDGRTMALEYRNAEGVADRYPKLARELLEKNCAVIFAFGTAPAQALRAARSPVPVVFLAIERDPVKAGIVSDLRRPDGNATGVYIPQEAMVGKRFEILREALPVRRLLVLVDPLSKPLLDSATRAAELTGMRLTVVEFSRPPYDFEGALETGREAQAEALMLLGSARFSDERASLSALLLKHRLPSITFSAQHAEAGFLLAFSANQSKAARRAAEIGVQILKGVKPADIPVEQADEFELVVNLKTAKALSLKIPYAVLARATRVIE